MKFNYFDIHSHLNLSPLYEKRAEIITRMREEGIGTITVGVDYETSKRAIEIAEESPDICWATVGLHPTDNLVEDFDSKKYRGLALSPRVVAIGEAGLDYYRITNDELRIKNRQQEVFKKHIELAIEVGKPLMLHCRPSKGTMDAYLDAIEILNSYFLIHKSALRGNFHFFVGDISVAQKILDLGFTMSFDGPITFSRDYDELLKFLPLESIMAETDAPFAAPEPYRGQKCEPWMVEEVYKKIAEIRNENHEFVRSAILENVKRYIGPIDI